MKPNIYSSVFILAISLIFVSAVHVQTKLGTIIGFESSFQRIPLHVFYGIPYGQPPVGPKRFQPSKLVQKLPSNPYVADQPTAHCPIANSTRLNLAPIHEDCLHLNIWMPQLSESSINQKQDLNCNNRSLPVLVYFYGGEGSIFMLDRQRQSFLYDGKAFAALGDLVFITLNYRAGVFGQLYLPKVTPGNAGLFDQTLALSWIQNHISKFCGDPTRVTIMGNSYGSMAVGFHLLSPHSKPFFQNAIMQSGSALFSPYMPELPHEAYQKSVAFADEMGCTHPNPLGLKLIDLGCLQRIPFEDMLPHLRWLQPFFMFGGDFFDIKTVEEYHQSGRLVMDPMKKLMVGLVNNEVCISSVSLAKILQSEVDKDPHLTRKQLRGLVSRVSTKLFDLLGHPELSIISPMIGDYYASEKRSLNGSLSKTIDSLFSDICFNCPSVLYAKQAVKALLPDHVHAFLITHAPKHHLQSDLDQLPNQLVGVCHADELQFNFAAAFQYEDQFPDQDRRYTRQLIQTLAQFVHERSLPRVRARDDQALLPWPASQADQLHFVEISLDALTLSEAHFEPRCTEVWSRLRPVLLKMTPNDGALGKANDTLVVAEPENGKGGIIASVVGLLILFIMLGCCFRSCCCRKNDYSPLN